VNKLVFSPYSKDELVKITEAKIGFSVVDKKALEFIAAKVSASSGDARKYLELVTIAIQSCRQKLPLITLNNEPLTKPVVTIRQAMMAIRDSITKYTDIIQSLTTFEKVTLCVGVHLARKFDGNSVTISQLKDLTMECFGADNDVSIEDFKGVVERLIDSGLLLLDAEAKRKLSAMRMGELMRFPIGFDLQLEDVVSALDDTLMKEDFYKRLVERVKAIKC
jgi:Cdc6-like AAA superfamily ATPase